MLKAAPRVKAEPMDVAPAPEGHGGAAAPAPGADKEEKRPSHPFVTGDAVEAAPALAAYYNKDARADVAELCDLLAGQRAQGLVEALASRGVARGRLTSSYKSRAARPMTDFIAHAPDASADSDSGLRYARCGFTVRRSTQDVDMVLCKADCPYGRTWRTTFRENPRPDSRISTSLRREAAQEPRNATSSTVPWRGNGFQRPRYPPHRQTPRPRYPPRRQIRRPPALRTR